VSVAGDVVVFVGPTLPAAVVTEALPDAVVLPPAAMGDILRAAAARPSAVLLIDGLFEKVPAVWHKELLWVLDQGIPVFGASSMGALRAAELHRYGMIGVGRIFEQFADGTLTDDDEVTVSHLAADDDFRAVSEAMVNIRATTDAAVHAGVVSDAERAAVVDAAKARFYPERGWDAVFNDVCRTGMLTVERCTEIGAWIDAGGHVDAKATDARAALEAVAAWSRAGARPVQTDWVMERTIYWAVAVDQMTEDHDADRGGGSVERVLDELRLDPDEHQRIADQAFVRVLANALADARSVAFRPEETQAALDTLRGELGLTAASDVEAWIDDQAMSTEDFRTIVRGDARVRWAEHLLRSGLGPTMIDLLRRQRRYAELEATARHKRELLREHGLDEETAIDSIEPEALVDWWFGEGSAQPRPVDLDAYVISRGLGNRAEFLRAVRREYWYRRLTNGVTAEDAG
jgi:hypothetical protein